MKSAKGTILIWNKWNKKHIKKHGVSMNEVEQGFEAKKTSRESYRGREVVIGKTRKGRTITIILSFKDQNRAYVVTARDSSKKERKIYND